MAFSCIADSCSSNSPWQVVQEAYNTLFAHFELLRVKRVIKEMLEQDLPNMYATIQSALDDLESKAAATCLVSPENDTLFRGIKVLRAQVDANLAVSRAILRQTPESTICAGLEKIRKLKGELAKWKTLRGRLLAIMQMGRTVLSSKEARSQRDGDQYNDLVASESLARILGYSEAASLIAKLQATAETISGRKLLLSLLVSWGKETFEHNTEAEVEPEAL
jgi:hypothetical protein